MARPHLQVSNCYNPLIAEAEERPVGQELLRIVDRYYENLEMLGCALMEESPRMVADDLSAFCQGALQGRLDLFRAFLTGTGVYRSACFWVPRGDVDPDSVRLPDEYGREKQHRIRVIVATSGYMRWRRDPFASAESSRPCGCRREPECSTLGMAQCEAWKERFNEWFLRPVPGVPCPFGMRVPRPIDVSSPEPFEKLWEPLTLECATGSRPAELIRGVLDKAADQAALMSGRPWLKAVKDLVDGVWQKSPGEFDIVMGWLSGESEKGERSKAKAGVAQAVTAAPGKVEGKKPEAHDVAPDWSQKAYSKTAIGKVACGVDYKDDKSYRHYVDTEEEMCGYSLTKTTSARNKLLVNMQWMREKCAAKTEKEILNMLDAA